MDKNTIWAIVLSTLVIIGSYFLLPKMFGKKDADVQNQTAVEVVAENNENNSQSGEAEVLTDTLFDEETQTLLSEAEETEEYVEPAKEEKITINTGVAEIIFTDRKSVV